MYFNTCGPFTFTYTVEHERTSKYFTKSMCVRYNENLKTDETSAHKIECELLFTVLNILFARECSTRAKGETKI